MAPKTSKGSRKKNSVVQSKGKALRPKQNKKPGRAKQASSPTGPVAAGRAGKGSASKKKAKKRKKGKRKKRKKKRRAKPDVFSAVAMENAYYISHNAGDFLSFRGFKWTGGKKKRGKSKKKKRAW
ncbi:uncharacterized protein LOC119110688 [Pollicipes pollicipes]|uniref:uncharacterized protein LOC119110688 n=1 Tax=Pollicipes pollicipes TaxID=41117 RepID=UPI0018855696|nr:uncharacterized protein LOC119110688 [Pollicipes pollicipes]